MKSKKSKSIKKIKPTTTSTKDKKSKKKEVTSQIPKSKNDVYYGIDFDEDDDFLDW